MRKLYLLSALIVTYELVLVSLVACAVATAQQPADLYGRVVTSTVAVGGVPGKGWAAGWVFDHQQKLIVTNKHVVGNQKEVTVLFPVYKNGALVTAKSYYAVHQAELLVKAVVAARDDKRDLALLRVDQLPDYVKALRLAPQSARAGDQILMVGNSGANVADVQKGHLWTSRKAQVKAKGFAKLVYGAGETFEVSHLKLMPASQPGDSGGPVVNEKGELVAVVASNHNDVGFAVDVSEVRIFLDRALHPTPPSANRLVGYWTVSSQRPADGAEMTFSLALRPNGTCTIEGTSETHGTYQYANGALTVNVSNWIVSAAATTWLSADRFTILHGGMLFTLSRR